MVFKKQQGKEFLGGNECFPLIIFLYTLLLSSPSPKLSQQRKQQLVFTTVIWVAGVKGMLV